MLIQLEVSGSKPIRRGQNFWWKKILEFSAETSMFTAAQLDGASDPYNEEQLRLFLRKLVKAGFIERLPTRLREYRLLRRQSQCPGLTDDGRETAYLTRLQNMWNVIRRKRNGFTVMEVVIEASTETHPIKRHWAYMYITRLEMAGLLKVTTPNRGGHNQRIYVLLGSANSGPKPPRRMSATLIYDPNRDLVLGEVVAEEDRT